MLLEVMHRTMRAAPGVGLAAPQSGSPLGSRSSRTRAHRCPGGRSRCVTAACPTVLVNPRYKPSGDGRDPFYEGCLCVPGYQAVVERPPAGATDRRADEQRRRRRRGPQRLVRRASSSTRRTTSMECSTCTVPTCARWPPPRSSAPGGQPSRAPPRAARALGLLARLSAFRGVDPGSDPGMNRVCTRDEPGVTPMSSRPRGDLPWNHDTGPVSFIDRL